MTLGLTEKKREMQRLSIQGFRNLLLKIFAHMDIVLTLSEGYAYNLLNPLTGVIR